jgi:hypothetical protein
LSQSGLLNSPHVILDLLSNALTVFKRLKELLRFKFFTFLITFTLPLDIIAENIIINSCLGDSNCSVARNTTLFLN